MNKLSRGLLAALTAGALCVSVPLAAQEPEASPPRSATTTVFARYAPRILKIQVVEIGSAAKTSTGTGFYVTGAGRMMTNYHVISDWIQDQKNHRIEILHENDSTTVARVIAIDVIADLAILETGLTTPDHFTLDTVSVLQGERLYSLGHPGDLGLSIVEGTYNGFLKHTLYPKIHFTGSINPGMSGGPTITDDGRVVGVNVSTMGNQRGFLVPRDRAVSLLAQVSAPDFEPTDSFFPIITRQVLAFQDEYLNGMFEGDARTVDMGDFTVPTEPKPIFRCWGNADRDEESLVETLSHWCSIDDEVFIAADHDAGVISLEHEVLVAKDIGKLRFTRMVAARFANDHTPGGTEEHVTSWRCTTRNVRTAGATLRAAYCLRRLRKLPGLYDVSVKVVTLGDGQTALLSTLTLEGVSASNAERVTTRWMERISWR